MNAAQVLLAGHDPGQVALVCGAEQLDYGALRVRVAACAGAWRRRGVGPGDRVAIRLPDGIDWVCAFLGVIWAGGVAVGVNPRIGRDEWHYVLSEGRFQCMLVESGADTPVQSQDRVVLIDTWLAEAAAATPVAAAAMDERQPAFWTHSSGTTGKPKAIVHGHRSVLRVERVAAERLGIGAADRLFASSRLFFCYPLANSLLAGLKLGATVILDPAWPSAHSVATTIARQRPTVFFSVPSLYRDLLREGRAESLTHSGLRQCVSAGEALPERLHAAWREHTGMAITNGFGASETLCLVLLDTDGSRRLTPSPGVQVTACGPEMGGAPTRIHIRAPTVALGYWQRPDAQAQSFRDGGYCPADLFEQSDVSGLRFAGREDSLVKVRGRWVDLAELEERVAACPGISEAAAVAVPDDDGVDAVALFYVLAPGAPDGTEEVLRALAGNWPHYQRPHRWQAIAALPRTGTGKLTRRKLQELHAGRAVAPVSAGDSAPGLVP